MFQRLVDRARYAWRIIRFVGHLALVLTAGLTVGAAVEAVRSRREKSC